MKPYTKKLFYLLIPAVLAILIGAYLLRPAQKNPVPSKTTPSMLVIDNKFFTLQTLKLNLRFDGASKEIEPATNISDNAFSIGYPFTYRRNGDAEGNLVSQLANGNTTYELKSDISGSEKTILLKDTTEIWSKMLNFTSYDPVRSFFTVGNSVVLAYDHFVSTDPTSTAGYKERDVIVDGLSMNEKFSFQESFAAFNVDNKLAYFGLKDKTYYFVLEGIVYELPVAIKELIDPACCSIGAYAVVAGNKEVLFYSENQDGYWYQNKITLKVL